MLVKTKEVSIKNHLLVPVVQQGGDHYLKRKKSSITFAAILGDHIPNVIFFFITRLVGSRFHLQRS